MMFDYNPFVFYKYRFLKVFLYQNKRENCKKKNQTKQNNNKNNKKTELKALVYNKLIYDKIHIKPYKMLHITNA